MRARTINETLAFKRGLDPLKAMGTGSYSLHAKHKTKSFKILDFIGSFGDEGVRYSDIQKFIYFEINKAPLGLDYFDRKDTWRKFKDDGGGPTNKSAKHGRGYWGTNLYGTSEKKGLLNNYCHKNKEGKWVLDSYPQKGNNIYSK